MWIKENFQEGGGVIVLWELASHARSALGYHIYPSILRTTAKNFGTINSIEREREADRQTDRQTVCVGGLILSK